MSTKEFITAWEELSPIQQRSCRMGRGILRWCWQYLVLARRGFSTCRIVHLLDVSRDKNFRILGLTFTNKAADEMRSRVAQLYS